MITMIAIIEMGKSLALFVPFLPTGATLLEASKLMTANHCSEVFAIGGDDNPVGVIRQVDIVKSISEGLQPARVTVKDAMLQPPPTVEEESTAEQVSLVLAKNDIKRVLVRRGKEIVGIIEAGELFDLISSSHRNMEVFKAISVRARLRIAELLSVEQMSVGDLSAELGIKPITVRHHLDVLRRNGIVEEIQEESYGKVGRPLSLFKVTKSVLKRTALDLKV